MIWNLTLPYCVFLFGVISRRLSFYCRRFGTFCPFHLHRLSTPVKIERVYSSETSALKAQTPGYNPKKHNTALNKRRKFEIRNLTLFNLINIVVRLQVRRTGEISFWRITVETSCGRFYLCSKHKTSNV